ncbi:mannosyltransferase [Vibrio brasiliensis]|uniref:glycosyltransferase family 32 protein n=1 Tax=Vibrio brasiliensis TaxID=170652 RepID=UPI001EFDB286|nr:TcdA/TcdB catalytic glycosyltransferase domain-containing protein [Vibrio brasiliensis]MCG9650446.1 mannosyltransferase [Vibrio brasiliensis]
MTIKKIHTVWLGSQMNTLAQVCIADWAKQGFDVTVWTDQSHLVKEWINQCRFARECLDRKLYAFVSDYIRLKVLQHTGGLYLDTDVTITKDPFELFEGLRFSVGYETDTQTGTAVIYSEPNSKILARLIEFYEKDIWYSPLYIGPSIQTHVLFKEGFKEKEKCVIYPKDYFFEYGPDIHKLTYTPSPSVYMTHWFNNSWSSKANLGFLIGKHKNQWGQFYEWQKQIFRKKR